MVADETERWTKPDRAAVRVELPEVTGSRVRFRWSADPALGTIASESFFVDYGSMDPAAFGKPIHWNTFFSLMLPVLSGAAGRVDVSLPEAVPVDVLMTWMRYHAIDNVTFDPVGEPGAREAMPFSRPRSDRVERSCILFGGGKDCSFAEGVMGELHPNIEVGLLSVDHTFTLHPVAAEQYRRRRERFVVDPARRRSRVRTPRVSTDFVARLQTSRAVVSGGPRTEPLLALYFGPLLPVMHWCGFGELIFNYDVTHFWTRHADGDRHYSFRRARPESCSFVADRYRNTFGIDLRITNLSFPIDVMLTTKILAERYPGLFDSILMCEGVSDPSIRWCGKCHKCAQFHLYALVYPHFGSAGTDVDSFFADSPFIETAMEILDGGGSRGAAMRPDSSFHAASFRHSLYRIARNGPDARLGLRARHNVDRLASAYGDAPMPNVEAVFSTAARHAGLRDPDGYLALCSEHGPVRHDTSFVGFYGSESVIYDLEPAPGRPPVV
jgi:hypothetical protein